MEKKIVESSWFALGVWAVFGSPVVVAMIFKNPPFTAMLLILSEFIGACAGAYCIWRIIQSVNRRHDPHTAKRPPDAP